MCLLVPRNAQRSLSSCVEDAQVISPVGSVTSGEAATSIAAHILEARGAIGTLEHKTFGSGLPLNLCL